MEKYYYFFDLNEVLIDRYPAKITNYLSDNFNVNKFVFIYSEKYNNSTPKKIPSGSKYFFLADLSKVKLDEIINKYPPNSLTTIAQRIPDMWLLTFFNNKNIPTFIVQHGLWSDKLERIPIIHLLWDKFSKFTNYVKYVKSICSITKTPFLSTLGELYRFLLKEDINIPETKYLNTNIVRAQKAFIFDKSWDDYYVKKYGYNINDLIYIGNPDFLLLKDKNLNIKEDAVCYICQSLVEDGRFFLKDYEEFLKILEKNVALSKKLYIKLHPRSKKEFYKSIEGNENVILTEDIPVCEYYIAHYTGMLATAKQISDNILIWKLKDHHIPEYFLQFGSIVTSNKSDLTKFLNGNFKTNNVKSNLKMTNQELKDFDPIKIIATKIFELKKYD